VLRVECPRCDKRLTHADRSDCAACGLDLNWAAMLGGAPQAPDMYEYSPRPLRRALPTAAAVLLPKRFWKSFSLEMPPQMRRLRAWRRTALLIIVIGIVGRCAVLIHYSFGNWASGRDPDLYWLDIPATFAAMLLGVPLMTAFVLPCFTPTLSKFRIRRDQIARCLTYAYTGVTWTALAFTAAGIGEWLRFVVIGTSAGVGWVHLSQALDKIAGLSLAAVALWWAYFLYVALKDYLRLNETDALALWFSTLAITWLTTIIIVLTISNLLSGNNG
jgi:hypothetical protein